ncbi:dipeptide/oligopeptide/nickel ABC transporter permease/ATP-binding protein [Palleronia sp. LCG004]|uniref:dipeptide/oligopeptide/nickel ABC transporter permease/ATP-binding protein n=1 Tax=Palleronia sp. LCG004 TaxID=3079304 RepID=UPI002942880C|nr:dipeptide/oligopeptide/nickel ABC transporter permease/ATP-binding protein [Palleronia sp. LCG004]WOI58235.1 dipeptide/oligopeptide/nickel ABC transporter permease/ATP-binding protein [Palleronia sp. LCG004]
MTVSAKAVASRLNFLRLPIGRQAAGPSATSRRNVLRRLVREPKGLIGLTLVSLYAVMLVFGPYLAPHDPYAQNFGATLQGPSAQHWFGTDQLGRDVLSRILTGARSSLGIGIGGVAIAFVIGVPLGILAGYVRGWLDTLVMRAADVMLSFPDIVFALAVVAILGATTQNVIIAVGLVSIPVFARTARAVTRSTMAEPFIEGSVSLGCSPARVIFLHILPNMFGMLATLSSLLFASTLLAASGLGFLGLGVQPPEPEWGTMLGESRSYIRSHPYLATFPGLFLAVSALAFNLLGEALRNIYDPTANATRRVRRRTRRSQDTPRNDARAASEAGPIVDADAVDVSYLTQEGPVVAVRAVSATLTQGRTLAVVGESGSGKSTFMRAVATLLPAGQAEISAGVLRIAGDDVSRLGETAIRKLRRERVGLVFQDAASALNPVMTVGAQLDEALSRAGRGRVAPSERRARAIALLRDVRIPDAESRLGMYPHEFSGGMKQRIVIALALSQDPDILLADEPTSALDVTIQQQILTLLRQLQQERGMAMMIVTHDLGLVTRYADDVAVMYAGRVVETGPVDAIFADPRHPYTRALRESAPRLVNTTGSRRLRAIGGEPPMIGRLPKGCAFEPRCPHGAGRARCRAEDPALRPVGPAAVACHFAEEIG